MQDFNRNHRHRLFTVHILRQKIRPYDCKFKLQVYIMLNDCDGADQWLNVSGIWIKDA